jgi:hypothetical protein
VELHQLTPPTTKTSTTTTTTAIPTNSVKVEIVQKIEELIVLLEPILHVWKIIFIQLNLEDTRRV